ncbi:TIGR02186 family protein [Thiohalorhabdus methylotrophus]|uniref:TIGR02186 family protein n=1 Tax=Thiohalorhabdus methylotrophus TaxID=3242694 RepID=A0ABV4TTI8_9GAMM
MRLLRVMLWLGLLAASGGAAAELVTDVSDDTVSVSYRYQGEKLLLFGSLPEGPGHVLIEIRGPDQPRTIQRKGQVMGLWMNVESMRFKSVPGFYAALSDVPLERILSEKRRGALGLGPEALFRASEWQVDDQKESPQAYFRGLVDYMRELSLYQVRPDGIRVKKNRLFRASVELPARVPVGDYEIVTRVIHNGEITHRDMQKLSVSKVGIEKWLYDLAHDNPATYGALAVAVALLAGWLVGMVTRGEAEH